MIKRKFGFWDKFVKNFSMTYIGYGKFLYYYRNPRTREVTYGKFDLGTRRTKFVLSSLLGSVVFFSFFTYYFYGSPAPATPPNNQKNAIFSKVSPDTSGFTGDFSLTKLDNPNDIEPSSISKDDISFSSLLWKETRDLLSKFEQKPDNGALTQLTKLQNLENDPKLKAFQQSKTKSVNSIATTIDDDDTEKMKQAFMLSDATSYSPEDSQGKVRIHYYTVRKGDSVGHLARKFGVSPHTIGGASHKITNMDELWPGTKLVLPSRDGIVRKIKPGQTLAMVANKYKISLERIIALNTFEDPDNIPVGTYVFLPDVKPANLFVGFMWPIKGNKFITSPYGWRIHPILGRRHYHSGMDLRISYSGIRAAKSGKVVFAGWMGAYGKTVVISHPGRLKTLYAHNSRLYVRAGQYVRQGQWIAKSGNTGRSTGAHLHFEIWKNGKHTNPLRYLRKAKYSVYGKR